MDLITEKSADYELLDSGDGQKLERFGAVILSRPDPQALWPKSLSETEWQKADAVFTRGNGPAGKWKINTEIPKDWKISLEDITFQLQLLPSKHVGVFPEQSMQWKWFKEKITAAGKPVSVLNLFANTGGASLACAQAGAEVTHVDASEFAVDMAFKNRDASGLSELPIRFIIDDARKFVEKEIRRGKKYDMILLDPPVYGKGVKGEVWNIDTDLMPLLSRLKELLSAEPLAIVLTGYASGYSHTTYAQMLSGILKNGKISSGELALHETASGKLLPAGIFARYEKMI